MQLEYESTPFVCLPQQWVQLSPDVCLRRVDDSIFAGFAAGQPSDVARFFGEPPGRRIPWLLQKRSKMRLMSSKYVHADTDILFVDISAQALLCSVL